MNGAASEGVTPAGDVVAAARTRIPDTGGSLPVILQGVLDGLSAHVAILDIRGRILLVNQAWRRFAKASGAPANAFVGLNYLKVCDRAYLEGDIDALYVRHHLRRMLRGQAHHFVHAYVCAEFVFRLRASRHEEHGRTWIIMAHEDITLETNARRELVESTERMVAVQLEERRRIGADLHDSVSQHLVAIHLGLAALRRGRATTETLDDMRLELIEAQKEIRVLSYLLHPPKLALQGLKAVLRGFVDGFARRSGLSISLHMRGDLDTLPDALQRAIFRVVQEATANAYRHASAPRISVRLFRNAKGVRLLVIDDGQGRSRPDKTSAPGVGVAAMQERVRLLGGDFALKLSPLGARVEVFIPTGSFAES
jgi:signal transduction histidine kinase